METQNEALQSEINDPEMVEQVIKKIPKETDISRLADFFKVMADPTRLKVLMALENGELCSGDLASVTGMSRSAISHQLKSLRQASLVKSRKDGKAVFYSLDDEHIHSVLNVALVHIREERKES